MKAISVFHAAEKQPTTLVCAVTSKGNLQLFTHQLVSTSNNNNNTTTTAISVNGSGGKNATPSKVQNVENKLKKPRIKYKLKRRRVARRLKFSFHSEFSERTHRSNRSDLFNFL